MSGLTRLCACYTLMTDADLAAIGPGDHYPRGTVTKTSAYNRIPVVKRL